MSEDCSYTEMISASAPEGLFSNRSKPNVGFWNRELALLSFAASKITPHRPVGSKHGNMTAVFCRCPLNLLFITPVFSVSLRHSESLRVFFIQRASTTVSAISSINACLYLLKRLKLVIYLNAKWLHYKALVDSMKEKNVLTLKRLIDVHLCCGNFFNTFKMWRNVNLLCCTVINKGNIEESL